MKPIMTSEELTIAQQKYIELGYAAIEVFLEAVPDIEHASLYPGRANAFCRNRTFRPEVAQNKLAIFRAAFMALDELPPTAERIAKFKNAAREALDALTPVFRKNGETAVQIRDLMREFRPGGSGYHRSRRPSSHLRA
jgi:hypothetical protein